MIYTLTSRPTGQHEPRQQYNMIYSTVTAILYRIKTASFTAVRNMFADAN
jgi:hypothetical protein